jgi:hypothetical protein
VPQVVEQGNLLLFSIHLLYPPAALVADRLVIKRVSLVVPLSEQWRRKRRRAFCLAGGIIIVSLAAMAYGITLIGQRDLALWLVPGGLLSTLAGLAYGLNASTLVTAKRITANYVWLRGVHRDYLAELPEWPGEWRADSLESCDR